MKINWLDWSKKSFQTAEKENCPIFMYMAPMWGHGVHVFEQNVLASEDVIKALSDRYIPIRIDINLQPEVFDRYNQGGWPSFCIITPDGSLLIGRQVKSIEELLKILSETSDYYQKHKKEIQKAISEAGSPELPRFTLQDNSEDSSLHSLDLIRQEALAFFDTRYQGFGRNPKLPLPDLLHFLLEDPSDELRHLAYVTLETIRTSTLCDHINGGFFRYCETENWQFPSMEKLLFENLLLLDAYMEAYRQSPDEKILSTIKSTVGYIENHLVEESGLFYLAQDSDGKRGDHTSYYCWSEKDFEAAIEDKATRIAAMIHYGIPGTKLSFHSDRSSLEKRVPINQVAMRMGIEQEQVASMIDSARALLKDALNNRPFPAVDATLFSHIQGKAIASYATASIILEKPLLLQRAFEIADALWDQGLSPDGGMKHDLSDDRKTFYLVDQVEVVLGFLELYRIAGRASDLIHAETLCSDCVELFGDPDGVGCVDFISKEEKLGVTRFPFTPFDTNSRLLIATALLSAYSRDKKWHEYSLKLMRGIEQHRDKHRLRDSNFGRALRHIITPPTMVDLYSGENAGQIRVNLLKKSPAGTLIRTIDPNQKLPWVDYKEVDFDQTTRMVVYSEGKKYPITDDIDLALVHLNENV